MQTYIVDASVGAKWFLNEGLKDEARDLFSRVKTGKVRAVVPDLFYVEMANIFRKQWERKMLSFSVASTALDELIKLPLERYSDHELSDVAMENAVHLGISAYDAVYVSLAKVFAAPLVTADNVLIKACKKKFDFILPLSKFSKN